MLDLTSQETDDVLDSLIANEKKAEEKAAVQEASNKGKITYPPYVALSVNKESKPALVRMVSGLCPRKRADWTYDVGQSRVVTKSWIAKDQNGKPWKIILPPHWSDENNPVWDFIDKVTEKVYTKVKNPDGSETSQKNFVYKGITNYGKLQSGPYTLGEIFEFVTKGGESPMNASKYKYANGLAGKEIFVANVIDRNDYQWHKDNKKFKVLIRSSNASKDPANPFKGELSAYSIYTITGKSATASQPLTKALVKEDGTHYNPWDIDLAIKDPDTAHDNFAKCEVVNASDCKEHNYYKEIAGWNIDTNKIVVGPLTDEEKSWEPVNLDKGEFGINSYKNIWDHIGNYITAFDEMTGSNFGERIQAKIEQEAALKKANQAEEAPAQPAPSPAPAPANDVPTSFDQLKSVAQETKDDDDVSAYGDSSVDDFMSSILG